MITRMLDTCYGKSCGVSNLVQPIINTGLFELWEFY